MTLASNLDKKKKSKRDNDLVGNRVETRFFFLNFEFLKHSRYFNMTMGSREETNKGGLKYPTDRIIDGAML